MLADLRYSLRLLRKAPVFTIVAAGTLALGIGANTAIFQLIDAVRLRMLPVKAPQELAEVHLSDTKGMRGGIGRPSAVTSASQRPSAVAIWRPFGRSPSTGVRALVSWSS